MKPVTRRRLLYLGVGLLVLGALVYGFWPKPIPVDIATATVGPLVVTIEEEGQTRIQERYIIRSPIMGYADRVTLDPGDFVRQGQTVVTLRPPRAGVLDPAGRAQTEAQVEAARAALRGEQERLVSARAAAALAESELRRAERLYAQEILAEQALEQNRTAAEQAQAAVAAAQQAVRAAEKQVEAARTALDYAGQAPSGSAPRVALESPVDGAVLAIEQKSEGPVQPGQPLLVIGDPGDLEVVVELLSDEAVRIKPGMPVRIRAWGGEEVLRGEVNHVEPQAFTKISALGVEEQRVRAIVSLASPSETWSSLGDNFRVVADFVLWADDEVLQIPRNAVFPHQDGHAVFLVRSGRAELHPVTVGMQNGLRTQILDGLQRGDEVVAHPDERIEDGIRVERQPVREDPLRPPEPEAGAASS